MAISADIAGKIVQTFERALDVYYGDSVATLKQFQDSKRKTFMEKLEEVLEAPKWRKKVADAVALLGTAKGVVTRLENERSSKQEELHAKHQLELADLKERQAREVNQLVAHYEPSLLEAKQKREERENELTAVRREAYFYGLAQEDDGRSLSSYYGSRTNEEIGIDKAIRERVDRYIEDNLKDDPDGQKVLKRIDETDLVKQLVYFEKNVDTMRKSFLSFIINGDLPPVTIKAWRIVKGKDISN